jgi:glutathione S-transferase
MVDVWTEVEAQQYYPAITPVVFQCIIFPIMRGTTTNQKVVDESLEKQSTSFSLGISSALQI